MNVPHISVCVCTYKRPELLQELLEKLENQVSQCKFTFSIVIVDNDSERSAEGAVDKFRQYTKLQVDYSSEPRQNISYARNKAVANATGEYVAFIDDDELPVTTWLSNLYKTILNSHADGVLGPVVPHYPNETPQWVVRSLLLERRRFPTKTVMNASETRTGNALIARYLFEGKESEFDPRLGKTGGEDSDFFRRMIARGYSFVWCDDAPVLETVSPDRCTRSYFIKRALLRGISEVHLKRNSKSVAHGAGTIGICKSICACILYTSLLPILLIAGHHLFMRYLVKDCDHIGKLLAICGIDVIKERDF